MFRFTSKPSSQYLAKITHLVKSRYVRVEAVQDVVSVVAAYCDLWGVCAQCSHNTDNVLYELYASTFNQVCNFS